MGRVVSPSGKRAHFVTLNPMRDVPVDSDDEPPMQFLDGDRTVRFDPLPAGTYRAAVVVDGIDDGVDLGEVTLVAGETREVEWRIP